MSLSCCGISAARRHRARCSPIRCRLLRNRRRRHPRAPPQRQCRPKPMRASPSRPSASLPLRWRSARRASLSPRQRPQRSASLRPPRSRPRGSPRNRRRRRLCRPRNRPSFLLPRTPQCLHQARAKRRSNPQCLRRCLLRRRVRRPGRPLSGQPARTGGRRHRSVPRFAERLRPPSRRSSLRRAEQRSSRTGEAPRAMPHPQSLNLRPFPLRRPASARRVPGRFQVRSTRPRRRGRQCLRIATDTTLMARPLV